MKRVDGFSSEEIAKKKRVSIVFGVLSLVLYVVLALLFFFLHNRSNSLWFLIALYVLTFGEALLSFYLLFYSFRRWKRLEKREEGQNEAADVFLFAYEGELCLRDYLPYRSLAFVKEGEKQERTLYLIASDKTSFEEGKRYEIQRSGAFITGLEEVSPGSLPSTFRDFLHFEWWKMLLVSIVLSVVWHYSFKTKDALKDEEILRVYSTESLTKNGFDSLLSRHLEHGIMQIDYVNIGDDAYTQTLLQSKGLLDGDIFLLREKYWGPVVESRLAPLPETFVQDIQKVSKNVTFTEFEGEKVGVVIDSSKATNYPIEGYFDGDNAIYLGINKNSSNAAWDGKSSYSKCAYGAFLDMLGVLDASL